MVITYRKKKKKTVSDTQMMISSVISVALKNIQYSKGDYNQPIRHQHSDID